MKLNILEGQLQLQERRSPINEEIEDLIYLAESNANAFLYGTLHSTYIDS